MLNNFLGLADPDYGNVSKGILYTLCDIFWKIVHAIGSLIDAITSLFYKIVGSNYLGSGSDTLVEEQDLFSKLFNQNIVSSLSLFMTLVAAILMAVFGGIAVIKQNYFSKEEAKSTSGVLRNMLLATVFLIALTPITLFAISTITTITSSIVSVFSGDASDLSIADVLFESSFSGDAIATYNSMYSTTITSWTEIKSDFIFDIMYGSTSSITCYWYLYLVGGVVILYNLFMMTLMVIKRIFKIIILYVTGPVSISKMVEDGGAKFKEWKNKALSELFSIFGAVIAFMVLVSLVSVIDNIELISVSTSSTTDEFSAIRALENTTVTTNSNVTLANNLAKVLLLVAGTIVCKEAGELFASTFENANDESSAWLEAIFNKVGKEDNTKSETPTPATRIRTITRTATSTRRVINYNETVPIAGSSVQAGEKGNVTTNISNRFNTSISNVDKHINQMQNRTSLTVNEGGLNDNGVKKGNYHSLDTSNNVNPTSLLDKQYVSDVIKSNDSLKGEWAFMKNSNSAASISVVKDFESASKELDSSILSGEQSKISISMNKYVDAYKNEEKVAKAGYAEFAGKSSKLSSDLSAKQQQELKNISNAYRKAQLDYGRTARKLSEISVGNMSTSDALKVKERADKQREKLIEASSRANDFYNNQKKGA